MNNLEYKEGIPEDKDRLCVFYDGDYYIDTFNNLSSSEQKQLLKWVYLPLVNKNMEAALNLPKDVEEIFQEEIKSEQFRREYLGQFLDDNNPEGYKTIDN